MIKATDCLDIIDIRNSIDQIDKEIVECLALRSTFVEKAADFKKTISEVKSIDRVTAMLEARRNWAIENKISPDFIQSVFERIVDFFVNKEIAKWSLDKNVTAKYEISDAVIEDAGTILALQKRAFIQEAEKAGNDYNIDPILQTLDAMKKDFESYTVLKATKNAQIIGSVRARMIDSKCLIGRLVVEPIFQGNGFGRALLLEIENRFNTAMEYELFTGENSVDNIAFYERHGYFTSDVFEGTQSRKMIRMKKKSKSDNYQNA